MLDHIFFDLLDKVSGVSEKHQGDILLGQARELYGLKNVAYLGVNIPSTTHGQHYVQCTYSDEWVRHYVSQDYVSIDPIVRMGLTGLMPLDWQVVDKHNRDWRKVFDAAKNFDVGTQGLTFPLRGRGKESALFCITADVKDREWRALKRVALRDFQVLAGYFHHRILKANAHIEMQEPKLSAREIECLKWAAVGKSTWDTSQILRISERTVKFHLDTARHKLDCLTKVQAVAKAVAIGLIPLG